MIDSLEREHHSSVTEKYRISINPGSESYSHSKFPLHALLSLIQDPTCI